MNSGAMLMAFSYAKTVIIPNICMAEDFPDELIYKYNYDSEESHVEQLYQKMKEAYLTGKHKNIQKGKELQAIVEVSYSKDAVKQKLLSLLK